jgi:hypothetical protein
MALTERQQKWFASVRASLERDTGKTLAEWVAIARTCPETKPRARTQWLKDNYGLGINRASHVLSEAFPSGLSWQDEGPLRAQLWTDPTSTAILEAIEAAMLELPQLTPGQRKGFSAWSHKVQFCAVRPLKGGRARIGLALAPDAHPRLEPARNESWSERLKAALDLASPADIDAELKSLIRQAWERS